MLCMEHIWHSVLFYITVPFNPPRSDCKYATAGSRHRIDIAGDNYLRGGVT
jgi:hypothetical protein